jgi:hypothetical protein
MHPFKDSKNLAALAFGAAAILITQPFLLTLWPGRVWTDRARLECFGRTSIFHRHHVPEAGEPKSVRRNLPRARTPPTGESHIFQ